MTDTSPKRLRELVDEALCSIAFVPKELLLALADEKEAQPAGMLYQHSETGRTTFVATGEAAHFEEHNPRWSGVGPLYFHPIADEKEAQPSPADVPLPEPRIMFQTLISRSIVDAYTTDQVRQYGQACANAARGAERERLCAAIKAADEKASEGDYMLDSDDCINVIKGLWVVQAEKKGTP